MLQEVLERFAREAPLHTFRDRDPVRCCHRYTDPGDQEVAALLAALFAFGKVDAFLPALEQLLERLGPSPRRFVEAMSPDRNRAIFRGFRLRLWKDRDVLYLLANLQELFAEHGTLEEAFLAGDRARSDGYSRHRDRLSHLASLLSRADPRPWTGSRRPPPYYGHLVVDPRRGSACKRWNLFLRWVVRPSDGVDLGLWRRVDPKDLVIPLDIHIGRISRQIGIRRRLTLDWKAAEEVTRALARLDPADPLRFDLPLSHLGISSGCRGRYLAPVCEPCGIQSLCSVYRRAKRKKLRRPS